MSGLTVQINCDFSGADGLDAVAARLPEMTPAMAALGQVIRGEALRNFREGGVFPARWKPSRRALRQGGQTLMDTGVLRNSINVQAAADGVAVGTPVKYAAIHQFGGTITQQVAERLNFHGKNGRFLKRSKVDLGEYVRGDRRQKKVVSFSTSKSGAYTRTIVMPERPFMPIDTAGSLSPDTVRRAGVIITRYVTRGQA